MLQKTLDLVFGACVASLIFWFVWEARSWSFHSRLFPWSIGFTILALALIQLAISVRSFKFRLPGNESDSKLALQDPRETEVAKTTLWRVITICGWIALFLAGIGLLGFRVGSLVLTVGFLKFAAGEGYRKYLALGLTNYFFFFFVFDFTLGVPLFEGMLAPWLGMDALDKALMSELVSLWRDASQG